MKRSPWVWIITLLLVLGVALPLRAEPLTWAHGNFAFQPLPNLQVGIQAEPQPAVFSQELVLTFFVDNLGPAAAHKVKLEVVLPDGLELMGIAPDQYCSPVQGRSTASCRLPMLAPDSSEVITLQVLPMKAEPLTISASVTSAENDRQISNNAATTTVSVDCAMLCLNDDLS